MPALSPIAVTLASAEHAPALASMNAVVHALHTAAEPAVYAPVDPAVVAAWFADALRAGTLEARLAWLDGEPVGFVCWQVVHREATPFKHRRLTLLVDQLAVVPGARRRGVARALMQAAHARAAEVHAQAIELDVRAFNTDAAAFYAALGYAPTQHRLARPG